MRSSTSLLSPRQLVLVQNELGKRHRRPPLAARGSEVLEVVDLVGDFDQGTGRVVEGSRFLPLLKLVLKALLH